MGIITTLSNSAEVFRNYWVGKGGSDVMAGIGILLGVILVIGIIVTVAKSGRDV